MTYPAVDPLDWATVQPYVESLLDAELNEQTVGPWLQQWSDLTAVLSESATQVFRDISENTADEAAEARFHVLIEQIIPASTRAAEALRNKLLAYKAYNPPPENEMMLQRFRAEQRLYCEANIPQESELLRLANEYEKRVGSMTVTWNGRQETLPQVQLHLREKDRRVREKAWKRYAQRYLLDRVPLNDLFLQMLSLRRQMAHNAGFSNFLDYQWLALARFDYKPQDAYTFHDAIEKEVVPLARRLYREQAAKLKLKALRPWDLEVDPDGEPLAPFEDVTQLEEGGNRIFHQVDPELAAYFVSMRDGYLDLASRPNKAPGGYCNAFPVSRRPYIFMNAVGTHDDVLTLLHEGGHAFHFMESSQQPLIFNHNAPMEFNEVASMAMELLAAPYMEERHGGFYSAADARRAFGQKLRGMVFFLPYMAVVDAFQHWVYREAPQDVTPADLDRIWSELWDRFMVGVDYLGLQAEKETGWHRKSHIFTAPLYYIEYGLAQIGAMQVWRNALQDQAGALAAYRAALRAGNTLPLPQLFRLAGAEFAFDRRTVGDLMTLVESQLAALQS